MARTKQTARKASGGKMPRKQLANMAAKKSYRGYITSLVPTAAAAEPVAKGSRTFYTYDNVMRQFLFDLGEPEKEKTFTAKCLGGATTNPFQPVDEHWLGVGFKSKYDGEGIKEHGRPNLNLTVAVDVSGSMGLHFSQGENVKLRVAQDCLKEILKQMTPSDRFGLIIFHTSASQVVPLEALTHQKRPGIIRKIDALRAGGGTTLSAAIELAMENYDGLEDEGSNRLLLLTDLESHGDTGRVMHLIAENAKRQLWTTVMGIDVDLSGPVVKTISGVPGSRFMSVAGAKEFQELVQTEFAYDVTPVAFDIKLSLEGGWTFLSGHGSPEVNEIARGSTSLTLSSEFPSSVEPGGVLGGLLCFRVSPPKNKKDAAAPAKVRLEYTDASGVPFEETFNVVMGDLKAEVEEPTLRKAVSLIRFVEVHEEYVVDDTKHSGAGETQSHVESIKTFRQLGAVVEAGVACTGDTSLKGKWHSTENSWLLDTIQQVVKMEGETLKGLGGTVPPDDTPPTTTDSATLEPEAPTTEASAPPAPAPKRGRKPKPTAVKRERDIKEEAKAEAAAAVIEPTTKKKATPKPKPAPKKRAPQTAKAPAAKRQKVSESQSF